MSLRIKIWGARGSLPSPLTPLEVERRVRAILEAAVSKKISKKAEITSFLNSLERGSHGGFGGNTPCIEVLTKTTRLVVDGGSGIRTYGYELLNGQCGKGKGEVHLFLTHFHWDHLIGLPFFTPVFIPGNTIHVYAVQKEVEDVFKTLFRKPYFPVPLERLGAKIVYHRLDPRKSLKLGDIQVTPYQLDHPDPCWGFRFEHGGKVYSHCVDTEANRVSREQLGPDLPLYQNVDLMVFDAQYTLTEVLEKVDWGHATATVGLDIAMREGIKEVLFMHHDPASTDEKIAAAEQSARRYYESRLKAAKRSGQDLHEVKWSYAFEGQEVEL